MTEQKHTPLPWSALEKAVMANDARCTIVAQCYEDVSDEEAEANAEFIVKACNSYDQNQQTISELIAALEFYADYENFIFWQNRFCEFKQADDVTTDYSAMGDRARAALAKAKPIQKSAFTLDDEPHDPDAEKNHGRKSFGQIAQQPVFYAKGEGDQS